MLYHLVGVVMKVIASVALGLLLSMGAVQARPLHVVGPWEIAGVDPAQSGYVFSRMQVAETLVSTSLSGELVPGLAERWSVSDDGLTWRFALRANARFHDETPVTAELAAESLRHAFAGAGVLRQLPIAEVSSQGHDVLIRLDRPFAAVPAYLVHFSTIILAPASYSADGRVTRIIGSGPYRVRNLTPPLQRTWRRPPDGGAGVRASRK